MVVLATLSAAPLPVVTIVLPVPALAIEIVPALLARKPVPLVVVRSRPVPAALKFVVEPAFALRLIAVAVEVFSEMALLKVIVPPLLLVMLMPWAEPPLERVLPAPLKEIVPPS